MKIASRQHFVLAGEHQRIVRHGIGLAGQHRRHMADLVETGTHDLGLTTQGIGVLDLVAIRVRPANRAAGQQMPQGCGTILLARMQPHLMNPRIERLVTSQRRIHTHCTRHQRGGKNVVGQKQALQRQRRRHLGSIQQRQPLLGLQLQLRNIQLPPGSAGRHRLAGQPDGADTGQTATEMGQGGQIAGRAHGTLSRHIGNQPVIDGSQQLLDDLPPDTGKTTGQRIHFQQHDQPNHRLGQQRPGARRVRQHQIDLQALQIRLRNPLLGQRPEPGVNAVHSLLPGHDVLDRLSGGVDRGPRLRRHGTRHRLPIGRGQFRQGHLARINRQMSHRVGFLAFRQVAGVSARVEGLMI